MQVRVERVHCVRRAKIRIHGLDHVGSDADDRMRANHPRPFAQHGDTVAARRVIHIEHRHEPLRESTGRDGKEHGGNDRQHGEQAEILQRQQNGGGGACADPRTAGEGEDDRDGEGRHHERRPRSLVAAEKHARQRGADDQHEQSGVGHVVSECPLRPLPEMIVVKDAVLEDTNRGAGGGERENDRHHQRGALAGGEAVDERNDEEQDHLLARPQARLRFGRERGRYQRDGGVCRQRPEEARHLQPLTVDQRENNPAGDGNRQQDLGDRNRELQRARHA